MNKCADFCAEHSGMVEFKTEIKKSHDKLWESMGDMRKLLVGTLITTIATLTAAVINLLTRIS